MAPPKKIQIVNVILSIINICLQSILPSFGNENIGIKTKTEQRHVTENLDINTYVCSQQIVDNGNLYMYWKCLQHVVLIKLVIHMQMKENRPSLLTLWKNNPRWITDGNWNYSTLKQEANTEKKFQDICLGKDFFWLWFPKYRQQVISDKEDENKWEKTYVNDLTTH